MDALEIIKQIRNHKKKVEKLSAETTANDNMMSFGTILSIMIGLYAGYLSYECNTKKNYSDMTKILFAVFAYIFGLFYLVYYYLFQYDTCSNL